MHDLPADKRLLTIQSRRVNDREAEVSVTDSGAGIAEESIRSIFEPFVTTKPSGMGMGLAISRTIIEAHGGEIHAENSSAGGAVFKFTLPLISDKTSAEAFPRQETGDSPNASQSGFATPNHPGSEREGPAR